MDRDYDYKGTDTVEFSKSITIDGNGHYLDGQRDMKSMNDVLNHSKVEFMSMSKPFVAQADFLAEWKANGEGESICQSCNNCYSKKTSTCFKY